MPSAGAADRFIPHVRDWRIEMAISTALSAMILCVRVCSALPASQSSGGTSAAPQSASSKPAADKIQTMNLSLKFGDGEVKCYLAHPRGDGPFPGVIVIHEWWGLNDWIKQQAERFAERGYAALAVDLYRGEVADDAEHAHELMRGLPDERAVKDLRDAFMFLSGHKLTRGKKIGAIGWCMGGGLALRLAINEPKLAATVVCYGRPVTDPGELGRIKGPLLGIWGGADRGIDVVAFKKALAKTKVRVAGQHVYPGAKHAFMNPNNAGGYDEKAAEKAWGEIDKFLAKELELKP